MNMLSEQSIAQRKYHHYLRGYYLLYYAVRLSTVQVHSHYHFYEIE